MNVPDWIAPVADFALMYAEPVLFGAGSVAALVGVIVVWRFVRTGHAHTKVGFLAVVLATAFAAEGMWEVATGPMELPPVMAAGLFGMFEVVMVSQGLLAKHKLNQNPPGDARRHMNFVWLVAAASGIVASTASNSLPEFLLRLCAPAVGAGIWWMGITADKPASAVQPTSWIWTPRRIGIHLGLIQPGQQDLMQVDRDRRIDAITVTAHRLHHGWKRLAGRRAAKLRRLALQADDAMVAEAQRRVARVHRIEKLTSPDAAPIDEVSEREQRTLDDVRLIMRQATDKLRAEHRRAFGSPQVWPVEPIRESLPVPRREPIAASPAEPGADSPPTATAAQAPARRAVTQPVRESAQKTDDKKLAQAYARLTKKLGREPSGAALAEAAGVSKATANRWKSNRAAARTQ